MTLLHRGISVACAARFMSEMGQNSHLPHRNTDARFTSISRPQQGGFNATLCAITGLVQCSKQARYSITSSARSRNDSGMARPSAFAVLRLATSGASSYEKSSRSTTCTQLGSRPRNG